MLWEIEHARLQGLPLVYLGYWIEGSRKLQYNSRFRPLEVRRNGQWQPLANNKTESDTGKSDE